MPKHPNPAPFTIQQWLKHAENTLLPITPAAQQDAVSLLSHCLNQTFTFLITHHQDLLTAEQQQQADTLLTAVLTGKPLAYVLGHTEFYGLSFAVNKDVLIPRSATECLVNWVLENYQNQPMHIADCGTGSGAIACALAKNRSQWTVVAIDNCKAALHTATNNCERLGLTQQINCQQNDWLTSFKPQSFDMVVSNPPYIDYDDPEVDDNVAQFEPKKALFAEENGLSDIQLLIQQAKTCLKANGTVVIEHGHQQQQTVMAYLHEAGYVSVEGHKDLSHHPRFVTALLPENK